MSRIFEIKPPQNLSAFVIERAARSYASYAPISEIIHLLKTGAEVDGAEKDAIYKGVISGWDQKRKEKTTPQNELFLTSLRADISGGLSDKYEGLLTSFGLSLPDKDRETQVIKIKAVREAMKFSISAFTVTAGKPVEIVFENPDAMQHNLVIGKPGSLQIIGKAADQMITQQDAAEKHYVPAIPEIISSTPLVNPDATYKLRFVAPEATGEYPFVCTFPGHWRLMSGIMKVARQ